MVDVSVVIVSYNIRELLAGCIASLSQAFVDPIDGGKPADYEVIVIDNASGDDSAAMVRDRFPEVKLVANVSNLGFAAATNQGIRLAAGRYVLLLNPDTLPHPQSLRRLTAFLDEHPQAGVVGAKLLNPDGSFQHGAFKFPDLWMGFLDFFPINHRLTNSRLNGRYPLSLYSQPFEIDHPLGACLMVRREVVDQVGVLDERFFIYCEEIDWCMRIKRAGWRIFCVPKANVVHYGGQSTKQSKGPMYVELYRSRFLLFKKHYSPLFQSAARFIVRLGINKEQAKISQTYKRGEISQAEYEDSLNVFRRIRELMSAV